MSEGVANAIAFLKIWTSFESAYRDGKVCFLGEVRINSTVIMQYKSRNLCR